MTRQMAVMKGVGFGCRDVGRPVLWFSVYISESMAALQVLEIGDACTLIKDYGVYNVRDLEGKACWVENDEKNLTIHYLAPCKA